MCVSPVRVRGSLDLVDRGSFRSGLLQNGFEAEEGDTKDRKQAGSF